MVIIGITGPIGHGKTSLGQAFQALQTYATHYESSDVITDLAQAWVETVPNLPDAGDIPAINNWLKQLPPLLKQQFGLTVALDQIALKPTNLDKNPQDFKKLFSFLKQSQVDLAAPNGIGKEEYRSLLQWMGGYFVKYIDEGIWWNYIINQVEKDRREGVSLCTLGGLRYPKDAKIARSAGAVIVGIERPDIPEADANDITEAQRRNIKLDCKLINNGSLADLQAAARQIYGDVVAGKLQKQYSAVQNPT